MTRGPYVSARTWMFVPSNRERMVVRAAESAADAVIFDLEDSVPAAEKDAARTVLTSALASPALDASPRRFVRINAFGLYPDVHADLEAAVWPSLDGLMVPKVESPETIVRLAAAIDVWESQRGIPFQSVRIVPLIESPIGMQRASMIAQASSRVVALAFGGEDYRVELGGAIPADSPVLLYARAALSSAAAIAHVAAIDGVWIDLNDGEGLARHATEGRAMGFAGKMLIHPGQIEAVNSIFVPTDEEVAYAREVVEVFEAAVARGEGAVSLRGQMLDAPVVARARALLSYSASHE